MVLRSQSRAGQSEVVVCADMHSEGPGIATRPEPEIARPETEFAPVAGPSSDFIAVETNFGPSTRWGTETAAETLSGYLFPARQEPEITAMQFHPFHPLGNPRSFTCNLAVAATSFLSCKEEDKLRRPCKMSKSSHDTCKHYNVSDLCLSHSVIYVRDRAPPKKIP